MSPSGHPDPPLPTVRADVVFRQVGDEWLLFDPATGRIHVLNLSAALIWASLDGTRTPDALADELRGAFSGTGAERSAEVAREVASALERFRSEGLVRDSGMGGATPD